MRMKMRRRWWLVSLCVSATPSLAEKMMMIVTRHEMLTMFNTTTSTDLTTSLLMTEVRI